MSEKPDVTRLDATIVGGVGWVWRNRVVVVRGCVIGRTHSMEEPFCAARSSVHRNGRTHEKLSDSGSADLTFPDQWRPLTTRSTITGLTPVPHKFTTPHHTHTFTITAGQDRTGQGRAGQDRTGQGRAGQGQGQEQGRAGQGRAG